MGTVHNFKLNQSLDFQWADLVYTEAGLLREPKAAKFVSCIEEKIALIEEKMKEQRKLWRAEVAAQTFVDFVSASFDEEIKRFAEDLKSVLRKQGITRVGASPRFARYFKKVPSRVIEMGLEPTLRCVRTWPDSLVGEAETELRAYAETFRRLIEDGDAAILARSKAYSATADHRLRTLGGFVEETNRVRQTLFADLLRKEQDERLPKGWARKFFATTTPKRSAGSSDVEDDQAVE